MSDQPVESVVPETEWDKTPMTYSIVPPTDENGDLLPAPPPLEDQTVVDLKAEIDHRNAGRSEDAHIPKVGNKDDLIAALQADDDASLPMIPTEEN